MGNISTGPSSPLKLPWQKDPKKSLSPTFALILWMSFPSRPIINYLSIELLTMSLISRISLSQRLPKFTLSILLKKKPVKPSLKNILKLAVSSLRNHLKLLHFSSSQKKMESYTHARTTDTSIATPYKMHIPFLSSPNLLMI